MVDERFEPANPVQCLPAYSERGAEAVMQSALDHFGKQDPGLEVGGDAQGFKSRG